MSMIKNERLEELEVSGEDYGIADLPPVPHADEITVEERHLIDLMDAQMTMMRINGGSIEFFARDHLVALQIDAEAGKIPQAMANAVIAAFCRSQRHHEAYIIDTIDR